MYDLALQPNRSPWMEMSSLMVSLLPFLHFFESSFGAKISQLAEDGDRFQLMGKWQRMDSCGWMDGWSEEEGV